MLKIESWQYFHGMSLFVGGMACRWHVSICRWNLRLQYEILETAAPQITYFVGKKKIKQSLHRFFVLEENLKINTHTHKEETTFQIVWDKWHLPPQTRSSTTPCLQAFCTTRKLPVGSQESQALSHQFVHSQQADFVHSYNLTRNTEPLVAPNVIISAQNKKCLKRPIALNELA